MLRSSNIYDKTIIKNKIKKTQPMMNEDIPNKNKGDVSRYILWGRGNTAIM